MDPWSWSPGRREPMKLKKTAELEALLFASGDPLTLERAAGALLCTTGEAADLL